MLRFYILHSFQSWDIYKEMITENKRDQIILILIGHLQSICKYKSARQENT